MDKQNSKLAVFISIFLAGAAVIFMFMSATGKKPANASERPASGPLHFARVVCMTAEKRRPPWAMADHSRKLIKYACHARPACWVERP